ncbi:DUF3616 domain-containing protein [Waterburya agarophytonicola K14]|uniref:DUF3616 domain-containing protein n=1 Tax=Waterburya agarophytonicola KI4 TaxID=2874699 RepID=A0A964FIB3_9CYAN|nr:DUF3616 domain-containing protein [Waterburya agarophytonicola]MCC0178319.1 DUF3616 domain-containing protein [Waterburya agarophytonicola KI4]
MELWHKKIQFKAIALVICLMAIALFFIPDRVFSQVDLLPKNKIKFQGKIIEDEDISAVGIVGKYILIGADEGNTIQVLEPNKKRSKYRVAGNIELLGKESKAEIDLEGMAVINNTVYVTGSHSSNYKTIIDENNRKNVFRFQLNPETGKLESSIEKASLQTILERDKILSQFANIPYNENGVDIEGIALKSDRLYFGFRTPVLHDDYIPIVVVEFEQINPSDRYELRYVNLDGNGIRDLVAVNDGFLILTDETGTKGSDYRVYFWDGNDDLPKPDNRSAAKLLREIPAKKNTKAEGLTILAETASSYRILVVYDGVAKGNPTIFEIDY